jgi:fumigallin biosynthesis monooxygenase-like protein
MPAINVNRQTVDLATFPDLVVIYLGMRARSPRGIRTAVGLGPAISKAVAAKPDGLLCHEQMLFSLWPVHMGMRQYWRDFESLERWARSLPHQDWWSKFLANPGETEFWHETYFMRGGMEAIFDDVREPMGLFSFAAHQPARGPMFSARRRAGVGGDSALPPVVAEPG